MTTADKIASLKARASKLLETYQAEAEIAFHKDRKSTPKIGDAGYVDSPAYIDVLRRKALNESPTDQHAAISAHYDRLKAECERVLAARHKKFQQVMDSLEAAHKAARAAIADEVRRLGGIL